MSFIYKRSRPIELLFSSLREHELTCTEKNKNVIFVTTIARRTEPSDLATKPTLAHS